jgi:hypothetical protein
LFKTAVEEDQNQVKSPNRLDEGFKFQLLEANDLAMIVIISAEHGLMLKRAECLHCGVLTKRNIGDFILKLNKSERKDLFDWSNSESSNKYCRFRKDCAFVLLDDSNSSILTIGMLESVEQTNIMYDQLKRLLFPPELAFIQPGINCCFLIFRNYYCSNKI